MENVEKRSIEQQFVANFVMMELKKQAGSLPRIRFLNAMMNGTKETEKLDDTHSVVRRYAILFDGVVPMMDLLDPEWDEESHKANKVLVSSVLVDTKVEVKQAA